MRLLERAQRVVEARQLLLRLEGICRKGIRNLDPNSLCRLMWALSQTESGVGPRTLEEIWNNWAVWANALDTSQLCMVSWAFIVKGVEAPPGIVDKLIEAMGFASEEQGLWSLSDVPVECMSYGLLANARLSRPQLGGVTGARYSHIAGAVIQMVQQRFKEVDKLSPRAVLNVLEAHALLEYSLNPKTESAVLAWLDLYSRKRERKGACLH